MRVRECVWWMCVCVSSCSWVLLAYVHVCLSVYMHVHTACICLYINLCMLAWYSDTNPFGKIQTRYRRFGSVLAVEPMLGQFEDRPMGWSRNPYWFVQWRSDGNSVLRLRHFKWVFALLSFFYFLLSIIFICYLYHFIWQSDILDQYDYLHHFMRHQWPFTVFI